MHIRFLPIISKLNVFTTRFSFTIFTGPIISEIIYLLHRLRAHITRNSVFIEDVERVSSDRRHHPSESHPIVVRASLALKKKAPLRGQIKDKNSLGNRLKGDLTKFFIPGNHYGFW